MKSILIYFLALATAVVAQTQPNPLTVNNAGEINRSVTFPSGKTLTLASGSTLAGVNVPKIYADAAAVAAGVPSLDGQLAIQFDTGTLWQSWDTSAGAWMSQFQMENPSTTDLPILTLKSALNTAGTSPLLKLHTTDFGYSGPLILAETDAGTVFSVNSDGEMLGATFAFWSDTNTGVRRSGVADEVAIFTNNSNRVVVSNSAVTLGSGVTLAVDKTITPGATVGAQTINKIAGSVNFAAAATSLVVTNSKVTTSSVILLTIGTNDASNFSARAVAASGSFTIHVVGTAPAAETRVNFLVVN